MQSIKLFIPILQEGFNGLDISSQNLSITFNNRLDDSEEGKFLSLFSAQKLAIELYKLKEDAFKQCLCFLRCLFLVEQSNESIIDKSCRNIIITKIDQFQQSPSIQYRKHCPLDPQQTFMQLSPLLFCIVSLLQLILTMQNDLFQLLGFQTFYQAVFVLLHYILLQHNTSDKIYLPAFLSFYMKEYLSGMTFSLLKCFYIIQGLVNNMMEDSMVLPPKGQQKKEGQKYRKVKVLGQGSMGRAYLVQGPQNQKLYVMKRINIGHLGPKQKESALRQAQLHSLFSHPNIVEMKQVYQTTGEKLCIVMQYAQGGDLQEFLTGRQGKLINESNVLSLFSQLCLGLQQVHAKKIIHRDLKTANIFLTQDKQLKIGDFGISKSLDKTSLDATAMIGTPYYLSPQMVEGKPYSTKADIWALGVILYQLCALKLPFQANSLPVLALKILKGSFPPIPNQYSKDLKALLLQMLSVDQKKRPTIDSILLKPIVYKHLSKQNQLKIGQKQEQKKQAIKQKQKKDQDKKVEAIDKQKEMKIKAKKQKQQKRQEMRRQMRQDLKKRVKMCLYREVRNKKQPESQTSIGNTGSSTLIVPEQKAVLKKSPAKVSSKQITKTPKPKSSIKEIPSKEQKKQQPMKPWKNKKPVQKKDITIQMYVPQLKPKENKKEQQQTIPPGSDFNVQIYVSNKPQNNEMQQTKQETRKSLPILQPVENYHYSQNKIQDQFQEMEQKISQEDQFSEDSQSSACQIDQIIDNIKNIEELTKNFPDPSKSVCLYEQSDNFESTLQVKPQPRPQQVQNLKHLLNSESLQELRLILEDRLGVQKFLSAYSTVKQHLDQYYQMLMQHEQQIDRNLLRQKYVFNKQFLRQKLNNLSEQQFSNNIELLYTLIMYQDLEMQKNQKKVLGANQSKYSRLF